MQSYNLFKIIVLAAFSFGIFLGQRAPRPAGSANIILNSFGFRHEHNNHIFKHLNNFFEDAKQEPDWATADASDEKIGQNSFQERCRGSCRGGSRRRKRRI